MQLEIINLSKKYGKNIIFSNFNILLDNEKYNFVIGANGSGKSTFIKCIINLTKYQGSINKNNLSIAYAPEKLELPDYITLKNYLLLIGHVNKINSTNILLLLNRFIRAFNLSEFKDQYLYKLSMGTRQKISIIQALLQNTDVYIFDEPLNGLDNESKKVFMDELRILKRRGKIIIITTHKLQEYKFRKINKIDFNNKDQYQNVWKTA